MLGISAFDRVCYNKVYGFRRRTFTNLRQDQRRHQLTAAEKVFVGEALKDLRSVRAMDAYRSLSPDVYEKCFFLLVFAWFRRYILSRADEDGKVLPQALVLFSISARHLPGRLGRFQNAWSEACAAGRLGQRGGWQLRLPGFGCNFRQVVEQTPASFSWHPALGLEL